MHVHVARKREAAKLRDAKDFVPLSESGSTCTLFNRVCMVLLSLLSYSSNSTSCPKEWSRLAGQISETTLAISTAEKEAFEQLRTEVRCDLLMN